MPPVVLDADWLLVAAIDPDRGASVIDLRLLGPDGVRHPVLCPAEPFEPVTRGAPRASLMVGPTADEGWSLRDRTPISALFERGPSHRRYELRPGGLRIEDSSDDDTCRWSLLFPTRVWASNERVLLGRAGPEPLGSFEPVSEIEPVVTFARAGVRVSVSTGSPGAVSRLGARGDTWFALTIDTTESASWLDLEIETTDAAPADREEHA